MAGRQGVLEKRRQPLSLIHTPLRGSSIRLGHISARTPHEYGRAGVPTFCQASAGLASRHSALFVLRWLL